MRKICSHEAWNVDFTTRKNRIFRPQKGRKFLHSWNVDFTNRQKSHFLAAKMLKFGTCGKFAHTKLGAVETFISLLRISAFLGMKNEENFLSLCENAKMRKIFSHESWTLGFTTRKKSNFQASKMEKNELKNAMCPLNRGFRNSAKSHYQALKMKKICWMTSINWLDSFHQ